MMTGFGAKYCMSEVAKLDFDQHIGVLDFERVYGELGTGIVVGLAGHRIICPTVPRADDFAAFDHALTEWASQMETNVVHGGAGAIHVGDADLFVAATKLFCFVRGRKFGLGGEFGESRHVFLSRDTGELSPAGQRLPLAESVLPAAHDQILGLVPDDRNRFPLGLQA